MLNKMSDRSSGAKRFLELDSKRRFRPETGSLCLFRVTRMANWF